MTDSEIIKAFRCCYLNEDLCEECPCFKDGKCTDMEDVFNIPKQILDLINRQKEKIEKLQRESDEGWNEYAEMQLKYDLLFDEAKALIAKSKAEAVKEFANTLKVKKAVHFCKCGREFEYTEDINNFIDTEVEEHLKKKGIWG